MLTDKISSTKKYYIYGAQVVAYGAYMAIHHLWGKKPECFLVSCPEGNPSIIEGVPVCGPDKADKDGLVIVAVTELVQGEIAGFLKELGFTDVFFLTQHEEHLLMSAYFKSKGKFPAADEKEAGKADLGLYEVRNHRDKVLSTRPPLAEYEHTIQAGAALADVQIADIRDDSGCHISPKNKQYCEMTASYWVWKNTSHEWKGIEHYRRHLLIRPGMLREDVDALLPLPYLCYPNELSQFRRFVSEDVVQAFLHALKELHPDEYEEYLSIVRGKYQYTYNLVCARSDVFDDYCSWFFRITEHMEKMTDKVPELGNTRAISYVAEVLTNIYFMSHQKSLRLRHVEKAIYV